MGILFSWTCVLFDQQLLLVNIKKLGKELMKQNNFFVILTSFLSLPFVYELIFIIVTDCTFSNMNGF